MKRHFGASILAPYDARLDSRLRRTTSAPTAPRSQRLLPRVLWSYGVPGPSVASDAPVSKILNFNGWQGFSDQCTHMLRYTFLGRIGFAVSVYISIITFVPRYSVFSTM